MAFENNRLTYDDILQMNLSTISRGLFNNHKLATSVLGL